MTSGFRTTLFKPDKATSAALKRGARKTKRGKRKHLEERACIICGTAFKLYHPSMRYCVPCIQGATEHRRSHKS